MNPAIFAAISAGSTCQQIVSVASNNGIPGVYPEPGTCIRFDNHDGPCNGYPRKLCIANATEKRAKVMSKNVTKSVDETTQIRRSFIRPWYAQVLAWISGRL